jgi:asparagine synthase (glutamine-hydrolysing)
MAADLIASRAFRERGWVQPAAAEDLLRRHRGGSENHAESLWQVLCLETWARRFLDAPRSG